MDSSNKLDLDKIWWEIFESILRYLIFDWYIDKSKDVADTDLLWNPRNI